MTPKTSLRRPASFRRRKSAMARGDFRRRPGRLALLEHGQREGDDGGLLALRERGGRERVEAVGGGGCGCGHGVTAPGRGEEITTGAVPDADGVRTRASPPELAPSGPASGSSWRTRPGAWPRQAARGNPRSSNRGRVGTVDWRCAAVCRSRQHARPDSAVRQPGSVPIMGRIRPSCERLASQGDGRIPSLFQEGAMAGGKTILCA